MMKIFLDGASLADIAQYDDDDQVSGFTTNPSLLYQAGVTDYAHFAKNALKITDKPISFEVFADDLIGMEKQAREIASWGNVYVKIPITNTQGRSTHLLIEELLRHGVSINVTAVFTLDQMYRVGPSLMSNTPSIISIFAGRISDTGRDPVPIIKNARSIFDYSRTEVLWASPRSVFDHYRAKSAGADIITLTSGQIEKLDMAEYDLTKYSLDTVRMFYADAQAAGFSL